MKVIVAGSRSINLQSTVTQAIGSAFNSWLQANPENWKQFLNPEIVSGGARGVDWCGEQYARKHKFPLKVFKADWETHGKKAGILRNIEMGNYADALIAIWDGKSRGTKHMIDYMTKLQKPVFVYEVQNV